MNGLSFNKINSREHFLVHRCTRCTNKFVQYTLEDPGGNQVPLDPKKLSIFSLLTINEFPAFQKCLAKVPSLLRETRNCIGSIKDCFRDTSRDTLVLLRPETHDVATCVSGRKCIQSTELDIVNGSFCNLLVSWLFGLALHIFTVLTSPKRGETAVHCCDPAISVLVMLVSRNVFHVVSALQSIVCLSPLPPFLAEE